MKRTKVTTVMRLEAVRSYIAGETVTTIAKRCKVSKPAVYVWIREAKGTSQKSLSERVASLEARVTALELTEGKRL